MRAVAVSAGPGTRLALRARWHGARRSRLTVRPPAGSASGPAGSPIRAGRPVLPGRAERRRLPRPLRGAPRRRRAEQHLLPVAEGRQDRPVARRDARPTFRFAVKAQRGGSFRAMSRRPGRERRLADRSRIARSVSGSGPCCSASRAGGSTTAGSSRLLAAWPRDIPLTMEFPDPAWHVDETFAALADAGAALCATELPDDEEPPTSGGPARSSTSACGATTTRRRSSRPGPARIEPFLSAGDDAYVFFRHDEVGRGAELAPALGSRRGAAAADRSAARALGRAEHDQELEPLRRCRGTCAGRSRRRRPASPARPARRRRRP